VIIIILSNTMSLAQFSTCEISDALIKLSVPHGGYIPDINTISPNSNVQICGPAYTVQMVLATSHTSGSKLSSHFVDTAPSGSVIVIDVPPGSVHRTYTHETFYS
jgi:regulator of RNase E activity RraA